MELIYKISKTNDPKLILEPQFDHLIDFNLFINVVNSFHELTPAINTGIFSKNLEKHITRRFYFQFSSTNYAEHHYSFLEYIVFSNSINAIISDKENYKDLKLFYDVANALDAHLWNTRNKRFIIDLDYLENLKTKELKINISLKQQKAIDALEYKNRWFQVKTGHNHDEFIKSLKVRKTEHEKFENCFNEVLDENKLLILSQNGYSIIMGHNVPYIAYKDKADFNKTVNHNHRLFDYLNKLSEVYFEAMFFEYYSQYGIAVCVRSINGKLYYGNFTYETTEEFFGETSTHLEPIIPIDFNETSIIEVCKNWTGITLEEIILACFANKEKGVTFIQEDYFLTFFN